MASLFTLQVRLPECGGEPARGGTRGSSGDDAEREGGALARSDGARDEDGDAVEVAPWRPLAFSAGNPRAEIIHGELHLFRDSLTGSASSVGPTGHVGDDAAALPENAGAWTESLEWDAYRRLRDAFLGECLRSTSDALGAARYVEAVLAGARRVDANDADVLAGAKLVAKLRTRVVEVQQRRLAELGYELPPVGTPKGSYGLTSRMGDTLYVCGHLPIPPSGELIVGRVGADLDADAAKDAADNLAALATLRPGAFAVTVTHELPERLDFETVDSEILELDGCRTLVFIAKKHPPGALGPPPGG